MVLAELQELQVLPVLQEQVEHQEQVVKMVEQDLVVLRELMVYQATLVRLDLLEQVEHQVQMVKVVWYLPELI